MGLATIAAELYALAPGDFTAARNEQAKAVRSAGGKDLAQQIRRLPRPSASAWVVNMLLRRCAGDMGAILDLGASLRKAQENLDVEGLRELGRQRHELLASAVRKGRALAEELGHPISDPAAAEVEQTLSAAMSDAGAAAAVRSGLLTTALSSNGFEPVDLSGAVAVPVAAVPEAVPEVPVSEGPGRNRRAGRTVTDAKHQANVQQEAEDRREAEARQEAEAKRKADAKREAGAAARRAAHTEAEREAAERRVEDMVARRGSLAEELDELRNRIDEVQQSFDAVDREVRAAKRTRDSAVRAAEDARQDADQARRGLDRLSGN